MIPRDKQLHLAVGFALAFVPAVLGFPTEGLSLAIVVGCLKELWDARHPLTHTADFWDFAATVLGGLVGSVAGWLV